jgi:cytochrome c oxidase cbb3-type subunit 3
MRASHTLVAIAVISWCSIGCGRPKSAPVLPDVNINFAQLFATNCSGCHGPDGKNGPAPRLNDPLFLAFIDRQSLQDVIANGRQGTPMPAFAKSSGGFLTAVQVNALVNGIESRWARPVKLNGVTMPAYTAENAPPGNAARGQAGYQRNCMMCHGFGKFKGMAGPVIDPSFLALISDQNLRTTIVIGRPDWGMPDWRYRIPHHVMSDQDISDVVAWLSSQRPKTATQPAPTPRQTSAESKAQTPQENDHQ